MFGEGVAVGRPGKKRSEDKEIERASQQLKMGSWKGGPAKSYVSSAPWQFFSHGRRERTLLRMAVKLG